jgi:proteasome alpha subunit
MIDEPYRWVEAIANRREYIEHQLAGGSPIAALSFGGGILFLTLGRERQKVFEIYDRIALGAIGHPGDIERLRMAAIEVASTEGFTRSTQDVSLRRLAMYSLSPALKAAFEQVYGPPYLARLLFGELGRGSDPNLFVRMEYDGSIHTNGGSFAAPFEDFGVISGTAQSTAMMERFLREKANPGGSLEEALKTALEAWTIGHLALTDDTVTEPPDRNRIDAHLAEQTREAQFEAAALERNAKSAITYRSLSSSEVREMIDGHG